MHEDSDDQKVAKAKIWTCHRCAERRTASGLPLTANNDECLITELGKTSKTVVSTLVVVAAAVAPLDAAIPMVRATVT